MALYWNINGITAFIVSIPYFVAAIISLKSAIKHRYRQNILLFLSWFFMWLWAIGQAIADITLLPAVKMASYYCIIPAGFAMILLLDSVSREYVDPFKFGILVVNATLFIVFSFPYGDTIEPVERWYHPSLASTQPFKSIGAVYLILSSLFLFIVFLMIHLQAPQALKKYSRLNVLGAFLTGVLSPAGYFFDLSMLIPGLNGIVASLGTVLIALSFAREPKLAYILPFKALRLTVINTNSGIALFTHSWIEKGLIDDSLFSGMMHGLSGILNEAVGRGNVREILLDRGVLIIERHPVSPVAFILVANKSTLPLDSALHSFSQKFEHKYKDQLDNLEMSPFRKASVLIDECFPFVPTYD